MPPSGGRSARRRYEASRKCALRVQTEPGDHGRGPGNHLLSFRIHQKVWNPDSVSVLQRSRSVLLPELSTFSILCSCEIIRDWKSGDSLCYAFIEFEKVSTHTHRYIHAVNRCHLASVFAKYEEVRTLEKVCEHTFTCIKATEREDQGAHAS